MTRSPTQLLADVRDFLLELDRRQGTVLDDLAYDIDAALMDLDYERSWEWEARCREARKSKRRWLRSTRHG